MANHRVAKRIRRTPGRSDTQHRPIRLKSEPEDHAIDQQGKVEVRDQSPLHEAAISKDSTGTEEHDFHRYKGDGAGADAVSDSAKPAEQSPLEADQSTSEAPPERIATDQAPPFFGWIHWAQQRRRTLIAAGLGFLVGLIVYALFSSEETPPSTTKSGVSEPRSDRSATEKTSPPPEPLSWDKGANAIPNRGYGPIPSPDYLSEFQQAPPPSSQSYPETTWEDLNVYRLPSEPRSDPAFGGWMPSDQYRDLYSQSPYDESSPGAVWRPETDQRAPSPYGQTSRDWQYQDQRPWGNFQEPHSARYRSPRAPYYRPYPYASGPYLYGFYFEPGPWDPGYGPGDTWAPWDWATPYFW